MTRTLTSHRRMMVALACMVGVVAVLLIPARADASHRAPRPPVVNPVVTPGGVLTPAFLEQPAANVDTPPGVNAQQIVIPPFDFGAGLVGLPGFIAQLIQSIIAQINAIIAQLNARLCASLGGTFCASP